MTTTLTPRLLGHSLAAEYCGMSVPHFDAHIVPHVAPLAFGQKRLWDRRSGIGDTPTIDEWLERFDNDRGRAA